MSLRKIGPYIAASAVLLGSLAWRSISEANDVSMFLRYPTNLDFNLQPSSQGVITDIYTSSIPTAKKVQEMEEVAKFFNANLTLLTDKEIENDSINVVPINYVQHSWLRDLFLVDLDSLLVSPISSIGTSSNTRNQRINLAEQITSTLEYISVEQGLRPSVTPFPFEGGQFLSNSAEVFAPDSYADPRSLQLFPFYQTDLADLVQEERCCQEVYDTMFDRSTIFVLNLVYLPEYDRNMMAYSGHIDMIMMPAQNGKMIVGDVELGNELINRASPEEREQFLDRLSQSFKEAEHDVSWDIGVIKSNDSYTSGAGYWLPKGEPAFQEIIKKAREDLEGTQEVIVVPMPTFFLDGDTYFLSYPNALVETNRGKAVIPSFGFSEMDAYAQEQYKKAGFEDQLIVDGIPGIATHSGIHCDYLEFRDKSPLIH